MTDWLIFIFFGFALLVGVYFTLVLLRVEMTGPPKPPPDLDDFGFGKGSPGSGQHLHRS